MKKLLSSIVLSWLTVAALVGQQEAPSSCRFPRIVGNSSKLVCASACLEIAKMAHSR
jgi:hypothetical protein